MATASEISALMDQLQHGTGVDAFEAAKRLANLGSKQVIVKLGKVARLAAEPHSREAAVYALGWHRSRAAVMPLLECAADTGEQDRVREQAIEGLAFHLRGDPAGSELRARAEDLMIMLLRSPSPTLRFWSCYGLGTLGCERAVSALRELSQKDPDMCPGWWYVHEEAEDAIEWIAGRPGMDRVPVHLRKADDLEFLKGGSAVR